MSNPVLYWVPNECIVDIDEYEDSMVDSFENPFQMNYDMDTLLIPETVYINNTLMDDIANFNENEISVCDEEIPIFTLED